MTYEKLDELITASAATDAFKAAIRAFAEGLESDLIGYSAGSPRIKILRVLMKLLDTFPDEKISAIDINAVSSCSAYAGVLIFQPGNIKIEFNWDCKWKAEQENMVAWYGLPDQTKAVQVYDYQCFEKFARDPAN